MADKSQGRSLRNASSSLGGVAERTLVDAGAARQATLVGIPGPGRRAAAGASKSQTPLILHEPTIVDPLPLESQDALEEPPEASVVEDDDEDDDARYVVRGGRVVGATAPRRRTGMWLLLLAIAAGYGGYRYRGPLKDQSEHLVALARAATATPSPRHEPIVAAPPVVPAPPVVATPPAAPTANAHTPVAKKASPTIARPPAKPGKKPTPARSAPVSDNPY